jgi:hypothetical protein
MLVVLRLGPAASVGTQGLRCVALSARSLSTAVLVLCYNV